MKRLVTDALMFVRICVLGGLIALQGCSSTQAPKYPAQLQMIIAQSAHQKSAVQNGSGLQTQEGESSAQAISVEQLLASVKNGANRTNVDATSPAKPAVNTQPQGHKVPDWIFKGQTLADRQIAQVSGYQNSQNSQNNLNNPNNQNSQSSQDQQAQARALLAQSVNASNITKPTGQNTVQSEQQRQLHLQFKETQLLPHQMQLMMAKQLVANKHMSVAKLVIGGSQQGTVFEKAVTAQKRAQQLIQSLGGSEGATVEYQPKIGDNIAIVTFVPRGR